MTEYLYLHFTKQEEGEIHLTRISTDNLTWYRIPTELRSLPLHKELACLKVVNNCTVSITQVRGFRNIKVVFTENLKSFYQDELGNFAINDFYLQEYLQVNTPTNIPLNESNNELLKKISQLEEKIQNMNKFNSENIEKKFALNKFDGSQEATAWITSFETECKRLNIEEQSKMIEILKLFLSEKTSTWYNLNFNKLPLNNWETWKDSFIVTYKIENWSTIRKAFNYKYISGSFIDYVVEKENLLLIADKNIPELFRIYQIIYNLPIRIQDVLNRGEITSINSLLNELKKIDNSQFKNRVKTHDDVNDSNKSNYKNFNDSNKSIYNDYNGPNRSNYKKKLPCKICMEKGYNFRFHPIELCRNKIKTNITNLNEIDENTDTQRD